MNSKSLKIRIKISIQPWIKIVFLIVAYYIGQQNAYKKKYAPDEIIMPKVRDLTAFRSVKNSIDRPLGTIKQIPKK